MDDLLKKLNERALNAKTQKEFLALTRQIIKIEELMLNRDRMEELEKRMSAIEQNLIGIDKMIMKQMQYEVFVRD
jgi:hypothetical protein